MKTTALTLFLLVFNFLIKAQINLVPNPSFELYSQCPDNFSGVGDDQISRASGWQTYRETSDYFNVCGTIWNVGVPNNQSGFQLPHTGSAYAGLVTYYVLGGYREFIGAQLSSALQIGQKYYLSFFVSLAGKQGACMASNNIGARFYNNPYDYVNAAPINNFAHLSYNTLITDTTNWTLITGSFIADSAYSYISLGNFFDDSNTDTLRIDDNPFTGYYYMDDICVSTDSIFAGTWAKLKENKFLAKAFTITPNPIADQLTIETTAVDNSKLTYVLIDALGRVVTTGDLNNSKAIINTSNLEKGFYCLSITNEKGNNLKTIKLVK